MPLKPHSSMLDNADIHLVRAKALFATDNPTEEQRRLAKKQNMLDLYNRPFNNYIDDITKNKVHFNGVFTIRECHKTGNKTVKITDKGLLTEEDYYETTNINMD